MWSLASTRAGLSRTGLSRTGLSRTGLSRKKDWTGPSRKKDWPKWDLASVGHARSYIEQQGVQDTASCGVFWPKWVDDEIEDEFTPKEVRKTHVSVTNTFFGVWRDKKYGEPLYTITSTKVVSKFSQMEL